MSRPPRDFHAWMQQVNRQLAALTRAAGAVRPNLLIQSDTLNRLEVGDTFPGTPNTGDTWFDTSGASTVVKVWTGTAWK